MHRNARSQIFFLQEMMAAAHSQELKSLVLEKPHHLLAGDPW
jgi:hypothetical protein